MDNIKEIISLYRKEVTDHNKGHKPYPLNDQVTKIASLFTPGQSYYYILNFYDLSMDHVSSSVKNLIGIEPEDFNVQKLLEICHPDDLPDVYKREALVTKHLNSLNPEDQLFYKYSYFFRIKDTKGNYHKMLHQATAITISEENKIGHVLAVHIDVSHFKFIDDKTMSIIALRDDLESFYNIDPENPDFENNGSESNILADTLSKRELDIVNWIAKGLNTKKIAGKLNLSEHTVRTHRKNILQKTNCANAAELVSRCLLEGVI